MVVVWVKFLEVHSFCVLLVLLQELVRAIAVLLLLHFCVVLECTRACHFQVLSDACQQRHFVDLVLDVLALPPHLVLEAHALVDF